MQCWTCAFSPTSSTICPSLDAKSLAGRVVLVHAFRNALIPVVTVMGLNFGALLTETMFAQPGMGKMIYDAILGNDFSLALTGLLFATLVTLLSNLATDIAYGALDPRIAVK